MRRQSKQLQNSDFLVKIMGMDLTSVDQGDTEVSILLEDDGMPMRFDINVSTKKLMVRYQDEHGNFTQKSYTIRQFLDYIKRDKKKK